MKLGVQFIEEGGEPLHHRRLRCRLCCRLVVSGRCCHFWQGLAEGVAGLEQAVLALAGMGNPVGINSKLKTALFAFRYMRIEQEVKAVVIGVAGFDACGPLKQNRPFHCAFHVLFTC
jgi:hypothetical protein